MTLTQLANQSFRIEGDAKSFNEFVEIWEAKYNVGQQPSPFRYYAYAFVAGQVTSVLQTHI